MDLNSIAVDVQKQDEGDWLDLGDFDTGLVGLEVLVTSDSTAAYKRLDARYRRKQTQKFIRGQMPDPVESELITFRVIAECALLDWKNLDIGEMKNVPYSKEKAIEILSDRKFERFARAVQEAVRHVGKRDLEWLEDTAKNSPRESSGN